MWAELVAADASKCLSTVANVAVISFVCHNLAAVKHFRSDLVEVF